MNNRVLKLFGLILISSKCLALDINWKKLVAPSLSSAAIATILNRTIFKNNLARTVLSAGATFVVVKMIQDKFLEWYPNFWHIRYPDDLRSDDNNGRADADNNNRNTRSINCNIFNTTPGVLPSRARNQKQLGTDISSGSRKKLELKVGVASINGKKHNGTFTEDTHCIDGDINFFAVFDGHDGDSVSRYLAENLPMVFPNYFSQIRGLDHMISIIKDACREIQENILRDYAGGGSTATMIKVVNFGRLIITANLGDSRTVLCANGTAIPLSKDHVLTDPEEKARWISLGAEVDPMFSGLVINYENRLGWSNKLGRAFGDGKAYAKVLYTDPDIDVHEISEEDEFVILASDGLWDFVENQAAVDNVRDSLRSNPGNYDLAAKNLAQLSYDNGSNDDITVVIVGLK